MSGLDHLTRAAERALAERPGVRLALATLHSIEGSSYRQPGARLLVDAESRVLAGAVSGGCLEGDIASHAAGVCSSGVPRQLTYDLREDLQTIWGFGAMCDGVAHLLLEPLNDITALQRACAVRDARQDGALITVIGETSEAGTREWQACGVALQEATRSLVDAARLTAHAVSGDALLNGRTLRCLVDPLVPTVSLILIGAGRGAEAFASIALTLGWRVTLIDHRPFVLQSVAVAENVVRIAARAEEGRAHITDDHRTAIALLTHQFAVDEEWLASLLPLSVGYIGVLGSRQRAVQLVDALRARGMDITARMEQVLHAPIGLDLGGETPEAIALASIAEIEAILNGRPGGSLRERQSPIHTRTPTPHVAS